MTVVRTIFLALGAVAAAAVGVMAWPEYTHVVVETLFLVLGGLAALALLRFAAAPYGGGMLRLVGRKRSERDSRPEQLARIERIASLSSASTFDVHYRLRPLVRNIAQARLARRGVDLELQPDAARAIVGDRVWELVRPDCEPPRNRHARGLDRDELRELVEALERT